MRAIALTAAMLTVGCSAILRFHECDTDDQCSGTTDAGGSLFCSDDHMCVNAVPNAQICRVSTPAAAKITSGALVIAGLFNISGPAGSNDHTYRNACDLATEEFILAGNNVAFVACDTGGDPDRAARAYRLAIDRFGAGVVVGPGTSEELFAVAKSVKERGVLIMSPSATNPRINSLDDGKLVWRTAVSDNLQARVLASLPRPGTRVDIVFESNSQYASGLKDACVPLVRGPVAPPIGFFGGNAAELANAIQRAANDAPSYVLLIADLDAPRLLAAAAKATGLSAAKLLMSDSAKKPSLWSELNGMLGVMARLRGTGPAVPAASTPSGMAFSVLRANYMARFQGEDPADTAFVSNCYDAFYAVAFAALALPPDQRSGGDLAANLARLSATGGKKVPVGLNGINDVITPLRQGGTVDLIGTSGPIDFDPVTGDTISAPIELWSVDTSSGAPRFRQDTVVEP